MEKPHRRLDVIGAGERGSNCRAKYLRGREETGSGKRAEAGHQQEERHLFPCNGREKEKMGFSSNIPELSQIK